MYVSTVRDSIIYKEGTREEGRVQVTAHTESTRERGANEDASPEFSRKNSNVLDRYGFWLSFFRSSSSVRTGPDRTDGSRRVALGGRSSDDGTEVGASVV